MNIMDAEWKPVRNGGRSGMGKRLTREEKRRIQRLRANAVGIMAALALAAAGALICAGVLRLA